MELNYLLCDIKFMTGSNAKYQQISAAILAGGEGRRMGKTDKSCLEISGEKLVSRIIRALDDIFAETFIITRTPENHPDLKLRMEGDVFEARSSLTGIHSALYHSKTDHVFVTACDSPFLNRELIIELLSRIEPDDDVLIPIHPDGFYEPLCAVYSKRCLPFIEQNLENDRFQIIRFFPQVKVRTVETDLLKEKDQALETFININTPDQLSRINMNLSGEDNDQPDYPQTIPRSAALKLIRKKIRQAQGIYVPVTDCAGLVASETICSEISLPEHDRSAMDGYAVSSRCTAGATPENNTVLAFYGEIRPSCPAQDVSCSEQTRRVLTGGIIPAGTDAVIPYEQVTANENTISISRPVREGEFIRKAGSDIFKGETIVSKGCVITPCEAALLAYAGKCLIPVNPQPKVAILAVGNELCDPTKQTECGLIPADNLILMKSLCSRYGISDIHIAPCANSPEAISEAVLTNSDCRLIVTTGGTGPGNRDFVFNSIQQAEGKPIFKGLAMHPAKSVFACKLHNSIVIGLPGPPVAVNLAFHTIVHPVINMLQAKAVTSATIPAVLTEALKGGQDREKLRPCTITEKNGKILADPLLDKSLSPRKVMNLSNGIIILPAGCGEMPPQSIVRVIRF
ncbi:NTP transferase domain-containing protein [Maridesulfovibrio sp.]|uniref:NTP transferase domain-containing protein n=1 Tax=Maridesulfovibrio sp. TaxID=2795000 RepID=UPI0029CA9C7E|nr:NTP transferase domain-containing protein [Maridesulfovibrio sp.]